jgi:hypothetical protein
VSGCQRARPVCDSLDSNTQRDPGWMLKPVLQVWQRGYHARQPIESTWPAFKSNRQPGPTISGSEAGPSRRQWQPMSWGEGPPAPGAAFSSAPVPSMRYSQADWSPAQVNQQVPRRQSPPTPGVELTHFAELTQRVPWDPDTVRALAARRHPGHTPDPRNPMLVTRQQDLSSANPPQRAGHPHATG